MGEIKLEGFKELADALAKLPRELADKELRNATSRAAATVRNEARRIAIAKGFNPAGKVVRNIYVGRDRQYDSGVGRMGARYYVTVRSGVRRFKNKKTGQWTKDYSKDAFYWRFHEFGTKFLTARPFLRPAFDSTMNQSIDAIRKRITLGLSKLAKQAKTVRR
jgi:HK97 gp10 family phage protein